MSKQIATTCIAASMIAAPAVVALQPAAAAGGVTMSVSKTTILVGKKEHFSGHAGANRKIVLQRKAGKSWRTLAKHHSDSSGNYKFSFIPAAPGHPTFRVATVSSKGTITSASAPIRVTVLEWHYLSDLQPTDDAGCCNLRWEHGAVEVNGHSYVNSVFFSEQGNAGDSYYVDYNLARKCRSFKSVFGVTDDSDPSSPVDFAVSGDGNQLYSTEQALGESVANAVDISGHLRLRISDSIPSKDPDWHNGVMPAFGNARILCSF